MGLLYDKYPKNQEVAAFYGLSLLWENGEDTDNEVVGKKSAAIAEAILAENPRIPPTNNPNKVISSVTDNSGIGTSRIVIKTGRYLGAQ